MRPGHTTLATLIAFAWLGCSPAAEPPAEDAGAQMLAAAETIDGAELRRHVAVLSDDTIDRKSVV